MISLQQLNVVREALQKACENIDARAVPFLLNRFLQGGISAHSLPQQSLHSWVRILHVAFRSGSRAPGSKDGRRPESVRGWISAAPRRQVNYPDSEDFGLLAGNPEAPMRQLGAISRARQESF
jgi:hypothetical protein